VAPEALVEVVEVLPQERLAVLLVEAVAALSRTRLLAEVNRSQRKTRRRRRKEIINQQQATIFPIHHTLPHLIFNTYYIHKKG
jgi:hypothetical protein